jgi:hypothetical protein
VADGLRRRGIDAVSVHDLALANQGTPDETHLANATEAGRVLVTYDREDFQRWDAHWRAAGRTHAGIVWCLRASIRQNDVGGLVRALETLSAQHDTLTGVCMMLPRPTS